MSAQRTPRPWAVIASPTDPDMYAVCGAYLVADKLPIEDARLIAAAPDLLAALNAIANGTVDPAIGLYLAVRYENFARAAIAKVRGAA